MKATIRTCKHWKEIFLKDIFGYWVKFLVVSDGVSVPNPLLTLEEPKEGEEAPVREVYTVP